MPDHKAALLALFRRPMAVVDGVAGPGIRVSAPAGPPAAIRDAATVVMLRDAPDGPGIEAYLLRRAAGMAFAGGMYAFPGGRVDPTDRGADLPWADPPSADALRALAADPALARALMCAAVRETFEECGVLLAVPTTGGSDHADGGGRAGVEGAAGAPPLAPAARDAARTALERHELALSALLSEHGLALRGDLLAPWARWVTPEVEPRRYDTRFFVAALPPGQSPGQPSREASSMEWTRPVDALAGHDAGTMRMLPPTAFTLAELAEYDDVASVMAAAHTRDLSPIIPKILVTGDEAHMLLPHDEAYDDPAAVLPGGRGDVSA
ncbi:NUDIX hydrolase [Frankia canadensis]|uniref:NUDIX hydrolase n=1 Tax=Frankia canadensis TaxID=1836972 RepID=A0A2I2KY80_9ACTN|nr:NUDIX hydrolase [Frankia canadensis]SNQ50624.1 NUDIX hydrolase [Frankia canadensis]SOU57914.1 NUDIX hydrolase [Frankia canadensis]